MKSKHLLALGIVFNLFITPHFACAQGTAFTYQGRLTLSGANYTGNAEFQPTLWAVETDGSLVAANTPASLNIAVTNGLFVLPLDFGNNFPGPDRWLQLEVRTGSAGPFTALAPRQKLTPSPYALYAGTAASANSVAATNLSGGLALAQLPLSVVTNGAVNLALTGTFTGNGGELTNVNAATVGGVSPTNLWKLTGNAGTAAGAQFIGTTDNQPLEFKVNNIRALRLEPTIFSAPNVIGGSPRNFVGAGAVGVTIAGGGATNYFGDAFTNAVLGHFGTIGGGGGNILQTNAAFSTISGGQFNTMGVNSVYSTIAGGYLNTLQDGVYYSTIGGGYTNRIQPNTFYATISGGAFNRLQDNASYSTIGGGAQNVMENNCAASTIGGGSNNTLQENNSSSTIGGGSYNRIQNSNLASTIGGGQQNTIQSNTYYSIIGGGVQNTIQSHAFFATIGGGETNTIQESSVYATIPGGRNNSATSYAFAAGRRAKANHTGAFVWADATDADFASTTANQFRIRANGGVSISSAASQSAFDLEGSSTIGTWLNLRNISTGGRTWNLISTGSDNGEGAGRLLFRDNSFGVVMTLSTNGNVGIGNTNPTNRLQVVNAYCTGSSWVNASDRQLKQDFADVDARDVLEKIAALSIQSWSYKTQPGEKHIGPVAQDFHAAFGLGDNDRAISTVDEGGVALAAIQGLNQKLNDELKQKATEITELRQRLEKLEQLLADKLNGGEQ